MRRSSPIDPEVLAWCAAHGHDGPPDALMVQKCAELTDFDSSIPVDLEVLASMQGVQRPVEVVDMIEAGCTYVDGDHCWTTGGDRYVPKNKSVDEGTALSACIRNGDVDAVENPGITNGRVVRVLARHLPYWQDGRKIDRVLAFLYK